MGALAAGLLMCRVADRDLEYFLVHPGGPFFKNKDAGFWTIPKGVPAPEEDLMATAQREFFEETGIRPEPPFFSIGEIRQKAGKTVHAWAFAGSWDPAAGIVCNTFMLEWPPRSGKKINFPEVDKAQWYTYYDAQHKIKPEQVPFLHRARPFFLNPRQDN